MVCIDRNVVVKYLILELGGVSLGSLGLYEDSLRGLWASLCGNTG